MRLNTRTWGDGPRSIALVHGTGSGSGTWHRVAPAIAGRGYRVVAVDLRGHGDSRRGYYSPAAFADDLVDTLATGMDIVLGHCVGGAVLSLAVERLRPRRAVYAEPYWNAAASPLTDQDALTRFQHATHEEIAVLNPLWTPSDIDVEVEARSRWDPRTLVEIFTFDMPAVPDPIVPSLVLLAETPFLAFDSAALCRKGFEVEVVAKSGHTLYHDNLPGFLEALEPWL